MSPLTLDRPRTVSAPHPSPAAPAASLMLSVGRPQRHPSGAAVAVLRAETEPDITLGAARADVLRLGFSASIPSVAAMRRLVAAVEREITSVGRERASIRIALDVEVVLAGDDEHVRRTRAHLAHLDALAGLTWAPAGTRVVGTSTGLVAAAAALAAQVGVDEVVLVPLGGGASGAVRVRELVGRAAHGRRSVAADGDR